MMQFQGTRRLLRRWTESCDSTLLENYEKYGPTWGLIASKLPGRKGVECRKRWLNLSGVLEAEHYESDKQLWIDGYERMTRSDGQKGWIKVPDVEVLPEGPFERIAKYLPKFKAKWAKKEAGWNEQELLCLREGYEQYIVPILEAKSEKEHDVSERDEMEGWTYISRKFSHRTATQCRNFFYKQHVLWNSNKKIQEVESDLNETEAKLNKE